MIEASNLSKSFGAIEAVRGIGFTVRHGEVVGFLGPNGAGKTTTFRMIAGTLGPSAGSIKIQGKDLREDAIRTKSLIGYMPESAPLYPELTVREYLLYRAELKRIVRKKRATALEEALRFAGGTPMLGARIGHLSKGYRQRIALADALLGNPPVLLLDEPTAGLDPNQVLEIRQLIRKLAPKHAILLSTHILSEVEATCSRALVLHRGKLVGSGSLDELRHSRTPSQVKLVVVGDEVELKQCLFSLPIGNGSIQYTETKSCEVNDNNRSRKLTTALIPFASENTLNEAIVSCVNASLPIVEAVTIRAALDEVFAHLTEATKPDAALRGERKALASEGSETGFP